MSETSRWRIRSACLSRSSANATVPFSSVGYERTQEFVDAAIGACFPERSRRLYPAAMAVNTTARPYADASPEELRVTILPEDREAFDEQYRAALTAAADTLRLDKLEAFLAHWRRTAWSQTDMGPERWRAMLARAEHVRRTGEEPPGTVGANEVRELIQARLAQA